jgi:hypothetical protein
MQIDNKISWGYRFGVIFLNSSVGTGYIILLISVVVSIFIASDMDFSGFMLDEESPKTQGMITGIDTVRLDSEDKTKVVYRHTFTFKAKNDTLQIGESYFPKMLHIFGDSVTIRYLKNKPSYAVIEGMQHKEKAFSVWVFIFPTIGYLGSLCILYWGIRKGKRLLNYADYGEATLARFMRQEATGEQGENGAIVLMVFQYETPKSKFEIFSKTETPEKFDTKDRIVLYLPWDNGDAIFKDDLWS